jgi:hypothetical protein
MSKAKKMKFKVLDGKFTQLITSEGEEGQPITSSEVYAKGSIVMSDIDLVKRYNRPGCRKFQRVHDSTKVRQIDPTSPQEREEELRPTPPEDIQDAYTGLTVADLREIADEGNIDLGSARKKDAILAILRSLDSQGGEEESDEDEVFDDPGDLDD